MRCVCPALAVLVAGGRSRRMGSDKCVLNWSGQPLWKHQLQTLRALNPGRVAVSAPTRPVWLPEDVEWLPDAVEEGGPFAGLLSSLEAIPEGLALLLAVDLPQMTPEWFYHLLEAGEHVGQRRSEKGYEPLAALYPAAAASSARRWVQAGRRDFQGWIRQEVESGHFKLRTISLGEEKFFHNVNTVDDLLSNSHE